MTEPRLQDMSDVLDVRIFGVPIAQGRPRAFKTPAGQVRVYDPGNARDWKRTVLAQVLERKPPAPVEGPLEMRLVFYVPRPKSLPKRERHPTHRPDLSNMLKAVEDALTGVVYRDDAQIVHLDVFKVFDASPGVLIQVRKLE